MIRNLHYAFMLFCCIVITTKTIAQSNSTLSTASMPYFQVDSLHCTGQDLHFTNIATGQAHAAYQWTFVGATMTTSSNSMPIGIHYQQEGDYEVCLSVRDSNSTVWSVPYCKQVHIGNPHISFTKDSTNSSWLPILSTFTSTSTNCISYQWSIKDTNGLEVGQSTMNPYSSYFDNHGLFTVTLIGTSVSGCRDTLTKVNYINNTAIVKTCLYTPTYGCAPLDALFEMFNIELNIDTLILYSGDEDTCLGALPINIPVLNRRYLNINYIYHCDGIFYPRIKTIDSLGNSETTTLAIPITVPKAVFPKFTVDSVWCINQPLVFHNTSLGTPNTIYYWYNKYFGTPFSYFKEPIDYKIGSAGRSMVFLVAINNGCAIGTDSVSIYTIDPHIDFTVNTSHTNCPPFTATFNNNSTGFTDYKWKITNLLDSTTIIVHNNLSYYAHTFTKAGNYDITLIGEIASGCTDSLLHTNYIQVGGPYADASLTADTHCAPLDVLFSISNIQNVTQAILYTNDSTVNCMINPSHYILPIMNGADSLLHTYTCVGTFQPILSLMNASGCHINQLLSLVEIDSMCIVAPTNHRPIPQSGQIIISPNPVNTIATLDIDKSLIGSNYTISNEFGIIMQTGILITAMQTIDVHTLSSGIYYLNTINTTNSLNLPVRIAIIR